MQKFTRDLSREVEINGERFALTLSAQGVLARPIGSRKPPLEITWAAILEAAQPATESSEPAPAPDDLPALLTRLDRWLKANRPTFFSTLKKGAAESDLLKLAKQLGRPVPDELAHWLRWHDGQDADLPCAFVGAFTLIDHEELAGEYLDRTAGTEGPWNPGWLPFLDDFNGSLFCLDTTRPGHPVIEVWRGQDHALDAAPSLTAWLESLLADFESGQYAEDPERGHFHKLT